MRPFIASMLYSYALIAYDLFLGGVLAGLVSLGYSAVLWGTMIHDKVKYVSYFAWF